MPSEIFKKNRAIQRSKTMIDSCHRELLNLLQERIIVCSLQGEIIFINDECSNLLGFNMNQMLGENIGKVLQPKSVVKKMTHVNDLPEVHSMRAHFSTPEPMYAIGSFDEKHPVDVKFKPVEINGDLINMVFLKSAKELG